VLDIDPGHSAIVVFTSGSTGTPHPHVKTWGSLTHAAQAVRESLAIASGSTLLGVVPPQHMWGFEMTIMLPLQAGCAVDAGCPLLPADIAAALARLPDPRWLVATPAHLRACALSDTRLPRLTGMLCSTAMLSTDLAQAMEQACTAPLFEIYGSTETGALAIRRPTRNGSFRTLGGIELDASSGTPVARGGQLTQPVALGDILDLHDRSGFVLRGRASDLVKIAGKRGSLAALNHELNGIPGVVDGVFLAPDSGRGDSRLLAFAVAPGLDAAAILGQLRARVDPVFLPRPLLMVDALPRNAAGKLPRESLLALAAAHGHVTRTEDSNAPQQQVEATHPALPHHFPGNPLVPGVWLLALVEQAARDRYGDGMRIRMVSDARFRSVLRPGEAFRIGLQQLAADRLAFTIERENVRIADGTLMVANNR
jgi:acyl-coenzyme A synthetase/AMP-(fatty) acid ligase